jgi:hypothetical protein
MLHQFENFLYKIFEQHYYITTHYFIMKLFVRSTFLLNIDTFSFKYLSQVYFLHQLCFHIELISYNNGKNSFNAK